ncbi:MAG TPA: GNAT family N-acetyltransferase [Candidatus Limnocylindrales bacterium]|nr:GNAT family N-acetyltransferase [Candidatus Limnocylindrales bacterium]
MPSSYRFRAPTMDDVGGVADLMRLIMEADYGDSEEWSERLRLMFQRIDLERDAWVVEDPEGRFAAAAAVRLRHPTRIRSFGGVLPEHRGHGLGSELLGRMEARARELAQQGPAGEEVWLGHDAASTNQGAKDLLERQGFELIRHFWKMGVELTDEPPPAQWPEGIRLERFRAGDERAVFEASNDAFQDHWEHQPHEFDEWRAWMVDRKDFDPSLQLLARDGDEIAGISLCNVDGNEGWVQVLGVRPPWRRRGLGEALLLASFRELRGRGVPRAVLGVDAANPTGATRLYERVGMRVLNQEDVYRKIVS